MPSSSTRLSPQEYKQTLKRIGILNRTGMEYANQGNFPEAFIKIDTALHLAQKINKKCIEAKVLNSLGIVYTMVKQWDEALLCYDEAIGIVADHYGTENVLFQTLGKNLSYLFT